MMLENRHFFAPDEVSDNFSNGFVDVAQLDRLKKPRACCVEPLQEEMLTLQLFAERELLRANVQCVESQPAGFVSGVFAAPRFWPWLFFFCAGHFPPLAFPQGLHFQQSRLHSPR